MDTYNLKVAGNKSIVIENKTFPQERALYGISDTTVRNCKFAGEEDGESALKECYDIDLNNCYMDLRYPMWHTDRLHLSNCELTANCRAALWYSNDIAADNCKFHGIKAFRECRDISLNGCNIISPEFGWRCSDIKISHCSLSGEYAFFESKNLKIADLDFSGKYSFQYIHDMEISRSTLKTKDAFWHTHNVTVTDSVLEGEYLAWYSDNLTLIRCHIKGTQPLCYCTNLTLIDCTMEDTDLSFEYSDVNATIKGNIVSVKNPKSGTIYADNINSLIIGDSRYPCNAVIKSGDNTIYPKQ
ncbi:MAG: DUF3737 family protein [Clostridia bacterium]|nr:DUF3737 family protein [Clostridia bacterium]